MSSGRGSGLFMCGNRSIPFPGSFDKMLSPSRSMELLDMELKPKTCMSQSLEMLDDGQLSHLIGVVAEDFRIKFEMRSRIRQRELAYAAYAATHPGRAAGCAFCPQGFHLFHRPLQCSKCARLVCKACHFEESDSCKHCVDVAELDYRRREWEILCPCTKTSFGFAKMNANDMEASQFVEWTLKAKLELHLIHFLADDLDSANVCFVVTDQGLELMRQQLMMSLLNYSNTSHFAFIDDSILEAKKIVQKRSNCIQESVLRVESLSYYTLLSHAVVSVLVSRASPASRPATVSRFHRLRPFFPQLSRDEMEGLELEGPTQYSLSPNWLLKPSFCSVKGSMRSQLTSRLVNSIATPDFFRYNGSTEDRLEELEVVGELEEDDESGYGTLTGGGRADSDRSDFKQLLVSMQRQRVEVKGGQVVRIRCKVVCEDYGGLDVSWYNSARRLEDGGRVQIRRELDECSLEIFDCNAAEDAGEIVCVAVTDFDVVCDAALLVVHEDDLAGEEPFFVEALSMVGQKTSRVRCGGSVHLRCRVVGYPQPYVSFFKDHLLIAADDKHSIGHFEDSWTLKIGDCDETDAGQYTAVAVNRINKISSKFRVAVISNFSPDSSKNKIGNPVNV